MANIKKTVSVILMTATAASLISSCGSKDKSTPSEEVNTPSAIMTEAENTRPTESIEQVGTVPDVFKKVIEEDRFRDVKAFSDRLMKVDKEWADMPENKASTICMMDLYGKELASYTLDLNDAYDVTAVTATEDGGFIFSAGFNGNYIPGWDQIESGYHSRVIKCDADGNVIFDTKLDGVEISALTDCLEKDGRYYFFGEYRGPERIEDLGETDVSIMVFDAKGDLADTRLIRGSSFDKIKNVRKTDDGFVLEIASQSEDGDFEGSGANYHEINWRMTVSDDLEITSKEIVSENVTYRQKIGEKDGQPVYADDERFAGFDAGGLRAYIDYGDTYLLVSRHITGEYEHTPAYISSIWYYWETVYSMYGQDGTLIFRASVDSSPDYSTYEYDDFLT